MCANYCRRLLLVGPDRPSQNPMVDRMTVGMEEVGPLCRLGGGDKPPKGGGGQKKFHAEGG